MKKTVFTGAAVAIITPMLPDGSIHYEELGRIIEDQIAGGTDAIVICGTTGEASTMPDEEHLDCIEYAVKRWRDVFRWWPVPAPTTRTMPLSSLRRRCAGVRTPFCR